MHLVLLLLILLGLVTTRIIHNHTNHRRILVPVDHSIHVVKVEDVALGVRVAAVVLGSADGVRTLVAPHVEVERHDEDNEDDDDGYADESGDEDGAHLHGGEERVERVEDAGKTNVGGGGIVGVWLNLSCCRMERSFSLQKRE